MSRPEIFLKRKPAYLSVSAAQEGERRDFTEAFPDSSLKQQNRKRNFRENAAKLGNE